MLTKKKLEINEKIRRVNDAMAQEGMPLSADMIEILAACFSGKMTFEEARSIVNKKIENGGLGGK